MPKQRTASLWLPVQAIIAVSSLGFTTSAALLPSATAAPFQPGVANADRPICAPTATTTGGGTPEHEPLGYIPIEPTRVLDSRSGLGTAGPCRVQPGQNIAVQVAGRGDIPSGGVAAAVLNITGTGSSSGAWVGAYPGGTPFPGTSNVNVARGDDGAALAIIPVGPQGTVNIAVGGSQTDVVIDVVGWFPTDGHGSKYQALPPNRVFDQAMAPMQWTDFATGVDADAVIANVTANKMYGDTYVSVVDSQFKSWTPTTSTLNVAEGLTRANRSFISGGASSSAYSLREGRTIVDVTGKFGADGAGYVPLQPRRVVDSREGRGVPQGKLGRGTHPLHVAGKAGVPADASAVVVTVTAVDATNAAYFTLWGGGQAQPSTSDLNVDNANARANLAIVPVGPDGTINAYLNWGHANLIVDVLGYFGPGGNATVPVGSAPPNSLNTHLVQGLRAGAVTDSHSLTFTWGATGAASFECDLDFTDVWTPCDQTATFHNLTPGDHSLRARAINAAGEADPKPAQTNFRVAPRDGEVMPGPATTGVPFGTELTKHQGNLYITEAGTVIDGLDVEGVIKVKAPNVTIKRSIIRGSTKHPTTATGLIMNYEPSAVNTRVEDVTLTPQIKSPYHEGLKGMNIHAERVDIYGIVDGAGFHGDNASIKNSWIHNTAQYTTGYYPGVKVPTHNDGIQIHGGSNFEFVGNRIEGADNAAVQVGPDAGPIANLLVSKNWLNNGGCTVNVHDKGRGQIPNLRITDNLFGRDTRVSNCAIIATAAAGMQASGNKWMDNLAPVQVRNGG